MGGSVSTSGPENCRKCDSAATPIVAENSRRNRSTRNSSKKRASQFFTNNSYQIFRWIQHFYLSINSTRNASIIKNGEFRASLHKFHTRLKNSSGISARLRGGDANNRKRNSYVIVVVVTREKHSRNGRQQKGRKFIFVSFE